MVGGFNTNVRYRGRVFHVQTEDSGQDHPHIITLLYEGGAILYSRKQDYEDRLDGTDVETEVRELMEEQHREMVRHLKGGGFDSLLGLNDATTQPSGVAPTVRVEFGQEVISDRLLDEVILAHLA